MKKCLLCGTVDEGGDSITCPYDGEATWALVEAFVPVTETPPEAPIVEAVDAPVPSKRRGAK